MPQLPTLASARPVVFVVAGLIMLAAASPNASGIDERKDSASASGSCTKAEASDAVRRLGLGHPELANPVYKVFCGAFAGPGSKSMVVSLLGPGSLGMIDWVVLGWEGNEWQPLLRRHQAGGAHRRRR